MPRLKYMEIPRADLAKVSIVAGQVIHCLDSGECFYDNSNTIRILSEDIITIGAIAAVGSPVHNRLYIDRHSYIDDNGALKYKGPEYATLYIYNNLANWQQVTDTAEVNSFLSAYTEVEPAVLEENGRNKAPYTLAKCVFTSDGDNLEDLVKEIKVLKMDSEEIIIDNAEVNIFNTNPPFSEYHKYPRRCFTLVSVNGIVLPQSYYKWLDNRIQFFNRKMHQGDIINLFYIYQADLNVSDARTAGYTDGGYIINGTIPIEKLEKITNSYLNDSDQVVPTAKALYDMHRDLLQKINTIDSTTQMYVADSSSNNYEIVVFIKKYAPTDCNTITLRVKYDLGSDCQIRINDFEPVPIFTAIGTPLQDGQIRANTIISLRYNAQQNIFYLINPDLYNVKKDRVIFKLDGVIYRGPMITIPITLDNFIPGVDCLDVYYQNIKLFEEENYTLTGKNITLNGFYAQDGDVFVFERTRVMASNL